MVFGEAPEHVRERNAGIPIHGDVTGRKWHKARARTGQGKQGGGGTRRRCTSAYSAAACTQPEPVSPCCLVSLGFRSWTRTRASPNTKLVDPAWPLSHRAVSRLSECQCVHELGSPPHVQADPLVVPFSLLDVFLHRPRSRRFVDPFPCFDQAMTLLPPSLLLSPCPAFVASAD